MNAEDLTEEPFAQAKARAEAAYQQAASDLRSKVEKAKADALKKVS